MEVANPSISPETRATLLLCSSEAGASDQSLNLREFNHVLGVLRRLSIPLAALLSTDGQERLMDDLEGRALLEGRIEQLLEQHDVVESRLARWTAAGFSVVDRTHPDYPERVRKLLADRAPPLLWVAGDLSRLEPDERRVAVVGSRDIDRNAAGFASDLGSRAAECGVQLVSGGARGVDRTAVGAVLDADGAATVVLPGDLARVRSLPRFWAPIADGRLVLISPYPPEEPFSGENALGRNRLIYCLADVAVVVETSLRTGGTWAGATEALRLGRVPVYVRQTDQPSPGNQELIRFGGHPLPHDVADDPRRFTAWLDSSVEAARFTGSPDGESQQLGLFTDE